MTAYKLSPYLVTIENRLTRGAIQYGLFHRLTGEIVEFTPSLQMFVTAVRKQGDVYIGIELEVNQQFVRTGGRRWQQLRATLIATLQTALEHPAFNASR